MPATHPPADSVWNTAGKVFWTFLAVIAPWVFTDGGWMILLGILHSAIFIGLVWRNPNN